MRKYLYNNNHIEVKLEGRDDMVCGPPTKLVWESSFVKHAVYQDTDLINTLSYYIIKVMSLMFLSNKHGDMIDACCRLTNKSFP